MCVKLNLKNANLVARIRTNSLMWLGMSLEGLWQMEQLQVFMDMTNSSWFVQFKLACNAFSMTLTNGKIAQLLIITGWSTLLLVPRLKILLVTWFPWRGEFTAHQQLNWEVSLFCH